MFSLLVPRIEYVGGFADFGSAGTPLQILLLDSKPSIYRYFSMGFHEWGIQYVYIWNTIMAILVQCHHDDPFQILAWDPGITGLGLSLTDRGEWIISEGNHLYFPLSFSFEERVSLFSDSLRSCSSSLWW
jgi:hypothetical protein